VQRGPCLKASNHTWGCRYRDKPAAAQVNQQLFQCTGSFNSEALRFSPTRFANFWDERPDSPPSWGPCTWACATALAARWIHLQSAVAKSAPTRAASQRKNFLYLFCRCPGGTVTCAA